MSKICPNCGNAIDDNAMKCPFCNTDFSSNQGVEDVVESSTINKPIENEVMSGTANVTNTIPEISFDVSKVMPVDEIKNVDFTPQESTIKSEANETSDTVMTNDNVLEEVSATDLINYQVDNAGIESISVVNEEKIEEEEQQVTIPQMPEPTIGEIDPNVLGSVYDQEEKINNEKIAEKRRRDEEERIKRESLEKETTMEKPDLLATNSDGEITGSELSTKKKKKHNVLNILTVIALIVAILFLVWYFLLRESNDDQDKNYMEPIVTYFSGYSDGSVDKMLSAWVPCLSKNDEVISAMTGVVNTRLEFKSFYLEYKEVRTEVLNDSDKNELNKFLGDRCDVMPTITDYKHVYIDEKVSNDENTPILEQKPEFYTVLIDGKWYMMAFQESEVK